MLKIKLNTLYIYLILGMAVLTYVFPGFIQFFIGVPSTLYTLGLTFLACLIVLFDVLARKKVIINKATLVFFLLGTVIIVSGLVNKTAPLKILLYLNFALIPIATTYLIEIVSKRKIDIKKYLSRLFLVIVLIQLPIVIIQKYGYGFLIQYSNANQGFSSVDFMFGSFALKADHALGFFLIIYLLSLLFKKRSGELKKTPYFLIIYISITIFIMESNLSKLVLLGVLSFYFYLWFYKRIGVLGIGVLVLILIIGFNIAKESEVIKNELFHIANRITVKDSYGAVTKGYAKRPHVIIYQLNYEDFKWIGNGPYDYYDIFKGEFKKTIHFSQIIWFYNDIGLIGIIIALIALLIFIKNINLTRESKWVLIGIMLLYLFMTNVLGDISMMLSLMLLSNKLEYN